MHSLQRLCPRCGSSEKQIKDGFTPAGSQRYRCKLCKTRYTLEPKEQGYDEDVRLQALSLYLEGLSLREISRLLSVNHQSVANWIHSYENHMPATLPPSILEIAILDGFYIEMLDPQAYNSQGDQRNTRKNDDDDTADILNVQQVQNGQKHADGQGQAAKHGPHVGAPAHERRALVCTEIGKKTDHQCQHQGDQVHMGDEIDLSILSRQPVHSDPGGRDVGTDDKKDID